MTNDGGPRTFPGNTRELPFTVSVSAWGKWILDAGSPISDGDSFSSVVRLDLGRPALTRARPRFNLGGVQRYSFGLVSEERERRRICERVKR